jgi:hypothetical protein
VNPYYKIGLAFSAVTLLLQLAGFIYFFGFFRGSFQEFKENTISSLRRLEAVFFTDVKVVPHAASEQLPAESRTVQRSKR